MASKKPADFTAETPLELLTALLRIPAFSGEEAAKADGLQAWLATKGIQTKRLGNNLWCVNKHFDAQKPTILLNSHLDTVKPNAQYTRDPWLPEVMDGKLYGLGSNDAGGALVSLIFTFLAFEAAPNLAYNLCFLASAEEENSGSGGVELVWSHLPAIDFALVGEPTSGELAVAEKGLLVVDATVHGQAGHAAREEGDNALYKALADLEWVRNYRFERLSDTLGPVKMTATIIAAGSQHNVVPGTCRYTLDIRLNDCYTHEEVLEILQKHLLAELQPRSCRLRPSHLPSGHPLRLQAEKLGMHCYGSPTTSDQALMPVPSAKLGPGDSARSHTANEFIYVEQLQAGVALYSRLLQPLLLP
ncbi:MAG: M20/M25/M40 family metallo-hydrolase [Sphingobacteriaceae bacterium]|nr:M20/M25/M40 family metallo-hydrolase [Sphingobacteriaceae bacterium]